MSDEEIRRMIEDATKEAMTQSFTEAGKKYIRAAETCEQKGDFAEAENLHKQAADNFLKAAEKYRGSKSFRIAALNMCLAGDVYSETADVEKALNAYQTAAEDLIGASAEHLMWGEDAETKKGTALAVTASMIYLMIGKDQIAFSKSRSFASEHASKLRFPEVVRLSQIPQMLESSINSMDLSAFSDAERAVVVELKAALSTANAQEFTSYVDKGVEMVREMLRGKLKVPKISSQLMLPVDMMFSDDVEITAIIENKGDGSALRLSVEWHLDEGLTVVSGESKKSVDSLPPGETLEHKLTIKASEELVGAKDYSLLVRGSYYDDLKTEYSLQAGPGTLTLKDFKESEKLLQDLDVTEGRASVLDASIDQSKFEQEPLKRIASQLSALLSKVRDDVGNAELKSAKGKISILNELIDTVDSIIGDGELESSILKTRESEKRVFAKEQIELLRQAIEANITDEENKIESEIPSALGEWDTEAAGKKRLQESATSALEMATGLGRDLDTLHDQLPDASGTDDPELATRRTKIRTALETIKSDLTKLETELEGFTSHSLLLSGDRPEVPHVVKLTKDSLESVRSEVSKTLDSKSKELE
ncbi:MAG: hypothetical protein ACTSU3_07625 [Candidatus Thorarchaeota archaeon]